MKGITSEQLEAILGAAWQNAQNARGYRQKQKAESEEVMRMVRECPGINGAYEGPLNDLYVVYVRTHNLGTKKWPDLFKKAEVSGLVVRETEKMVYTNFGEQINKEKILAVVMA